MLENIENFVDNANILRSRCKYIDLFSLLIKKSEVNVSTKRQIFTLHYITLYLLITSSMI